MSLPHPVNDAQMAEIKLHPNDKVMSDLEVVKKVGTIILALTVFEIMFYAMYQEGEVLIPFLCGAPLGLMIVAILCQSVMHFLGLGKMVINGDGIIFRTSRSGEKGKSIFDPLVSAILSPMAKMAMSSMDEDGDGKLSFAEILEDMEIVSKSDYEEMRKDFDLYDKDGDGFLSLKELEGFLTHSEDNWIEDKEKPENWWPEGDGGIN